MTQQLHGFLRFRLLIPILLSILFYPGRGFAVEQSVLLAAQNMLNQGQALEALELLQPHEEEYAGDKQYDYLYGLSLLDTGEPSSAIFAFQRALAVDPNFAGARLELARSYFDMGQMPRAQREFLVLNNQSPPAPVKSVIDKYLAAIEARTLSNRQGWRGFLQLGMGDDSNVNNATSADSFLGFTLSDESRETSSSVISTLGGARYDLPIGFNNKVFFAGSVNHRANNDASFTSTVNLDFLAGYSHTLSNQDEISTAIQTYSADVDGEFNNRGVNLTGQYTLNFSPSNQIGLFLRAGSVDYASEFNIKDIDQAVYGVNWAHVFSGQSRISMIVAAIAGKDTAVESDSPYGRDFSGLRLSLAYPISHRFNLFASAGSTDSDYSGSFFSDPAKRSDSFSDVSLGGNWRASKVWQFRVLLTQASNKSNIEIFEYDKTQVMFTARSEFSP
jgi:tetratricopeptide (TPR) repeat protein